MWLSRPAVSPISVPVEITCPSREFINYIINQLLNLEIKTLKFIRNPNSSPRQIHLLATHKLSSAPRHELSSAQLLAHNYSHGIKLVVIKWKLEEKGPNLVLLF